MYSKGGQGELCRPQRTPGNRQPVLDILHWTLIKETAPEGAVESTIGAKDRTRTGMGLRPTDFKSVASTNFATLATSLFFRQFSEQLFCFGLRALALVVLALDCRDGLFKLRELWPQCVGAEVSIRL